MTASLTETGFLSLLVLLLQVRDILRDGVHPS